MKSTSQHPGQPNINLLADQPDKTLILLIQAPDNCLLAPDNNFIGSLILVELLNLGLSDVGQLVRPSGFSGPLNRSSFIWGVADAHESANVVWALLEKASLAPVSRIYRFDSDEGILRHLLPPGGRDFLLSDLPQFNAATAAQFRPGLDQLLKSLSPKPETEMPPETENPS